MGVYGDLVGVQDPQWGRTHMSPPRFFIGWYLGNLGSLHTHFLDLDFYTVEFCGSYGGNVVGTQDPRWERPHMSQPSYFNGGDLGILWVYRLPLFFSREFVVCSSMYSMYQFLLVCTSMLFFRSIICTYYQYLLFQIYILKYLLFK